jgi:hypothetical protein
MNIPDAPAFGETNSMPTKNKRHLWGLSLFWWWVVSFWILVSLASGLEMALLQGNSSREVGNILVSRLVPWIFMTVLIIRISSFYTLDHETWKRSLGVYLSACAVSMGLVAAIACWEPLPTYLVWRFSTRLAGSAVNPDAKAFLILMRVTFQMPIFWGLVAVAHAVRFYERDHLRKLRETELNAQLIQARLQALQLQLNPHFLFNTLNSIAALVNENPATAERMIVALGDLLRLTLATTTDRQQVTVREEFHLLDQYLLIERIRFGIRLQIEREIDEVVLDDMVPVFILQPLVENAVKHGVEKQPGTTRIHLTAKPAGIGGFLHLEVTNDGPVSNLPLPEIKEGIGLSNTRRRLEAMFGSRANLELHPRSDGGFVAQIMIPRQTAAIRRVKPEPRTTP